MCKFEHLKCLFYIFNSLKGWCREKERQRDPPSTGSLLKCPHYPAQVLARGCWVLLWLLRSMCEAEAKYGCWSVQLEAGGCCSMASPSPDETPWNWKIILCWSPTPKILSFLLRATRGCEVLRAVRLLPKHSYPTHTVSFHWGVPWLLFVFIPRLNQKS